MIILKFRVAVNNKTFINFVYCLFLTIENQKVQTTSIEYSTCTSDSHNDGPYFIYLEHYSVWPVQRDNDPKWKQNCKRRIKKKNYDP